MSQLFNTTFSVQWSYEGLDMSAAYAVPMPIQITGPLKIFAQDAFFEANKFSKEDLKKILLECQLSQQTTYSSGREETQINILVATPKRGAAYRWPVKLRKTNLYAEGFFLELY